MQIEDQATMDQALSAALDTGYTLIDTAQVYGNERLIGNILKGRFQEGKLKRQDIFITTKVNRDFSCYVSIQCCC